VFRNLFFREDRVKYKMRYYGEEALGLIETTGMLPALNAADKMLKAADVELISYENIGSTLVTVMIKGDVEAVRVAVNAGAEAAAAIGNLTAHNVMPRPIKAIGDIVSVHDVDADDSLEKKDSSKEKHEALGLIEVFGLVFLLQAADAMCKAAGVELIGYENVASGYISVLTHGDVDACKAAVEAGEKAVKDMGGEVYSSVVIARPHSELDKIISRYSLDNLYP
jgi:carbon dioxide concentrating mechanism protein CcmO